MKVKMILPSLLESGSPGQRPIKYSLFPPLGLATLAGHFPENWDIELVDQHVMTLSLNDEPDLVMIEVYITNSYRAYEIADHYRAKGVKVILGGLHVTSMLAEALEHGDALFIGPADHSFPEFLKDFKNGHVKKVYHSKTRNLNRIPLIRRDLIQRYRYLVPNSLVVSRGCPHHCNFCYKDAFFEGGKSFYTQQIEDVLEDIGQLPGKHLYFLDDHLLGNTPYSKQLFREIKGMNRLFQGASTVDAILRGNLIDHAVSAGLRSIFIGFESINSSSLISSNKKQNLSYKSEDAIKKLRDLGVRVNGSFVFGLDGDGPDVFDRTVDWAVNQGLTTATFHIATPYPGTAFYKSIEKQGRLIHKKWDLYDTRQVVFKPIGMSEYQLKQGYDKAYQDFYKWSNILSSAKVQLNIQDIVRQFSYSAGWKKLEPLWNFLVQSGSLPYARKVLESILDSKVSNKVNDRRDTINLINHKKELA